MHKNKIQPGLLTAPVFLYLITAHRMLTNSHPRPVASATEERLVVKAFFEAMLNAFLTVRS